jgi:hypothetical protein
VEATGGSEQPAATEPAPVPLPDTTILAGPPPETAARTAVFKFKAQGASSKGFECSVDSGPFAGCSSPAGYSHLGPGQHVFAVRALSRKGDPDASPASFSWRVFEDLVPQSRQQQQTTTQAQPQPQPPSQPQPKPTKPKAQSPPILVG